MEEYRGHCLFCRREKGDVCRQMRQPGGKTQSGRSTSNEQQQRPKIRFSGETGGGGAMEDFDARQLHPNPV
jgi:hypothetical protein